MSWKIHEHYKHARRKKETIIFAKEGALDNVIDQRISSAITSHRNLTYFILDEIFTGSHKDELQSKL